jgi:hypothetical protein
MKINDNIDFSSPLVRKAEVLTQDEIDAMLTAITRTDTDDSKLSVKMGESIESSFKYSFEKLANINTEVAQEMIDNFKVLQEQIAMPFYQLADKLDDLYKENSSIKEKLTRIEKILRGGGDLLEDDI